jgi:hypothetical protein
MDLWMSDLLKGLPVFATSWSAPETFDAISAMGYLKDLKKDLLWLIPKVEDALHERDLPNQKDACKLLAAAIVRTAAVRQSYVETLFNNYQRLNAGGLAAAVAPEIQPAQEHLNVGRAIVSAFSNPASYNVDLCEKLRKEASLTPSDFRSHIHDCNILLNVYAKEFNYELAEIPRDEAQVWIDQNIPAVAAGYWRAYGFQPDDLLEWRKLGISGAPLAANWRRAGFEPARAVQWIREGIGPGVALVWERAGFEPPRAAALLRRGVTDPSRAPQDSQGDDKPGENEDDGVIE